LPTPPSKIDDNINDDNVNRPAGVRPDDILEAIHELRHLFVARLQKTSDSGDLDLTHVEGRVLRFFSRNPGATQRDLAAYVSRDKAQVARLVSGLKERRLLEARADDVDRRIARLHVTARGLEARAAYDRQRARLAKRAVAGMHPNERRELMTLLRRVRDNLERA
jgi:DNA-binding MarR family transcriptional regulator